MKRKISLAAQELGYTLKQGKRLKNLRLAIYCDGNVVVSAPNRLNMFLIEQFILEKSEWINTKLDFFRKKGFSLIPKDNSFEHRQYKNKALKLAKERLNYFNKSYGYQYNKISIRNQKSRWGSCSKKGNLNFNYKIALLPQALADYIIVHELCHLGEFNHSTSFWNLISKTIPNHLQLRKELNKLKIGGLQ